ncbi:MAG: TlyA family RNA methyltransferase [Magnetococcales bacterium]|nr:TlyA family RNA methyltransferase [Magnetococcales bacterium]NGZ06711.1 TlyA family RNA methyltransferase [Magnetococcales bacterium]
MPQQRLDQVLIQRGLVADEAAARALIMTGKVLVHERPVLKPGTQVAEQVPIRIKEPALAWASRGALKLEAALTALQRDVRGLICLDVGASTGGFTDLLLTRGALRVFALDVGYGQLAWKLVQDPRVVVMDRCNVRHLQPTDLPGPIDFLTLDLSFISLKLALPPAAACLRVGGHGVALVKPQFELPKECIPKGGVITNPTLHQRALEQVVQIGHTIGLTPMHLLPSPILGATGNQEFLYCFTKTADQDPVTP